MGNGPGEDASSSASDSSYIPSINHHQLNMPPDRVYMIDTQAAFRQCVVELSKVNGANVLS